VPEDSRHANNTLEWLLRLDSDADDALQLAALAHDIDRAIEGIKVKRMDFDDYDVFKAAHACNGAGILQPILSECGVQQAVVEETCRLVTCHEMGGDPRSDLLKDADSISFFDVNLPFYLRREGLQETRRRLLWGNRRLSERAKEAVKRIEYKDETLTNLVSEVMGGKAC
jgi:hypothetical protein